MPRYHQTEWRFYISIPDICHMVPPTGYSIRLCYVGLETTMLRVLRVQSFSSIDSIYIYLHWGDDLAYRVPYRIEREYRTVRGDMRIL